MQTLILVAVLTAVTAGALTALVTTWRRMNTLQQEAERLRESLARKRPATISLQQANLASRLETLEAEALALTHAIAPHAQLATPEDCVTYLRQVFEDQQRANSEYEEQYGRVRDELLHTKHRLNELRSAQQQLRMRRGSSEAQLNKLETTLASVMAERDRLRWELSRISEPAEMKKAG